MHAKNLVLSLIKSTYYCCMNTGLENRHSHATEVSEKTDHKCNRQDDLRHPLAELRYEVKYRCFERSENVEYMSREL